MTVCVGVKTNRGVLLGADSQGSAGGYIGVRRDVKAFRLTPNLAIAYTSSFRMGQVLRFHLPIERLKTTNVIDLYEWAVVEFVPLIREAFKEHGYAEIEKGVESGGSFLLALHDRLFLVEDDFQVGESADEFDATGSGFDVARGALYAGLERGTKVSPRKAATIALDAACRFNAYCGGPYTFVETRA